MAVNINPGTSNAVIKQWEPSTQRKIYDAIDEYGHYVFPDTSIITSIGDEASVAFTGQHLNGEYEISESKKLDAKINTIFNVGLSAMSVTESLVIKETAALVEDSLSTAIGLRTVEQAGISPSDATRIQNAANRTGQEINVVGSRANGTATAASDWDYIMSGNSAQRHSAASSLPRGTAGGEINSMGRETGIDIWTNYPNSPKYQPLDPTKPYVPFIPKK